MTESIRISLFRHGSKEFVDLLVENEIPIDMKRAELGLIQANGEMLEVAKLAGGVWIVRALAGVVVQWLKNRAARKVIVQTKDGRVVHLEGYDVEKAAELLQEAESMSVIQTETDSNDT